MRRGVAVPVAAGGFGAGIVIADAAGLSGTPAVAALVSGLALLAMVPRRRAVRRSRRLLDAAAIRPRTTEPGPRERVLLAAGFRRPRVERIGARHRFVVLLLAAALAGSGWLGIRTRPPPLPTHDGPFPATAASDPSRSDWGWGIELSVRTGPSRVVEAWVSDEGRAPRIVAGDRLLVRGWFERLGRDGFDGFLRSRGLDASVHLAEVRVVGPTRNPLLRLANAARHGLRRGAIAALSRRDAGLFLGLSIGDTSLMDREVEEDFRASGLGHLLAVSGSNVAMVLGPIIALATAWGLKLRGRLLVGAAGVLIFALMTRWEPSVVRAGAMAGLALAAAWGGRPRSTVHVLAAAVLIVLILDPSLATSLGFQLSVAATVGLATMAAPLAARLSMLPRWLALSIAATLAAQAAVTPLLLLHFGVVPTVTILANTLAFLAVAPALFLGAAAAVGGSIAEPLGGALGAAASLPLGYLVGVADRTARFALPSVTADGVLVPLAVMGAVVGLARTLRRPRAARPALIAVVLASAAWVTAPSAGPPPTAIVTFLDVGQGDAAVIRAPDGATVVIDAGPEEQQLAVELARLGVRRIDLAVASHAHADHVEGFPAAFARFPVTLLVEPGCPGDSPSYAEMLDAARDEAIPVRHPRGGDRYRVGSILVEVLGPDGCSPIDEPNDDSLVMRVHLGGATVLFAGDAEVPAQEDLMADGDPIESDVLKVPHHGGDTSVASFLRATRARVAVVSTGPNDYGHPHPDVVEVLHRAGMVVYRTDLAGDVTVSFPGHGAVIVGSG